MNGSEKDGKPVWVKETTVVDLDSFKEYPRETYDDVIKKLIEFKRSHVDCRCEPPEPAGDPQEG